MRPEIVLIAHNIRSVWNVGTFFRNTDCFGVKKIILTGYTATPPRKEITKTAIGAEEWVKWEYVKDPFTLVNTLKAEGFTVVGLEKSKDSVAITGYTVPKKIALILGHEVLGVSDELLSQCDTILHIEQFGKKESLNVSVASGIALFELTKTNGNY